MSNTIPTRLQEYFEDGHAVDDGENKGYVRGMYLCADVAPCWLVDDGSNKGYCRKINDVRHVIVMCVHDCRNHW